MELPPERGRRPLRILTVCSHNRTRSVMTMAMMQAMFQQRLGPGSVIVRSLGFGPEGLRSIPDAVDAMRKRGLDISAHRSRQVTKEAAESADLLLTSERDHVIKIAALSPVAYRQSMTMPEFVALAEVADPLPRASLREWVSGLTADRTARDYINGDVEEIIDPTGSAPRAFEKAVVEMEALCERAVGLIARVVDPPVIANRFDFD
jgi:protein-tyrosine-phosphatase